MKLSANDQRAVMQAASQIAAAWVLGITPRHLRDGDAPRNSDGSYNLREVVAWAVERADDGEDGKSHDQARKLRAEADLKEMEAERRAGELVPLAMVEVTLQRVADGLRTLGEDFGRSNVSIRGREVQKRINDMLQSISWGD